MRKQKNSQVDFISFLCHAIEYGALEEGDYLVCDNSTVHCAPQYLEVIKNLLGSYGIQLYLLPKYSPELNPCELVFAQIKRYLRSYRKDKNFLWEIITTMATIKMITCGPQPYMTSLMFCNTTGFEP